MRTSGRSIGRAGITLIELLIVMAVIAVLSGAAISLLSGGGLQSESAEAGRRVVTDIEFARSEAIARREERQVVFDEDEESYGVYAAGAAVEHPVAHRPFLVKLGEIYRGSSVDIVSSDFGGSDTLRFDRHGRPAAGGEVEVRMSGGDWRVRVAAETGHVELMP